LLFVAVVGSSVVGGRDDWLSFWDLCICGMIRTHMQEIRKFGTVGILAAEFREFAPGCGHNG
jgi:hypothetical protein